MLTTPRAPPSIVCSTNAPMNWACSACGRGRRWSVWITTDCGWPGRRWRWRRGYVAASRICSLIPRGAAVFFARTLEIPAEVGPRKDVSYFAHYEGFEACQPPGQVIIGRLAAGWCWRIPLRDCLSVGVVMNKDDAAQLGTTAEARLEGALPVILCLPPQASTAAASRRSPLIPTTNWSPSTVTGRAG